MLARAFALIALPALGLLAAAPAPAQEAERRPSHCIALVEDTPGLRYLHRASFTAPVPEESVRISYIDHAMFLIQTAGGLSAVTDYSGFIGPTEFVPDVATMNQAHSTHWTREPHPDIPHVLTGWDPSTGGVIEHHVDLGEMLVRNVSTNIRGSSFGGASVEGGNSIFVFEVAGLCIGHLGHLHHVPSAEQFAALGRLDVVMAPVDGGLTLSLPEMIETLQRLKSSVVIPMHWFSGRSLEAFIAGMEEQFRIDRREGREIEVSLRTLPSEPTVVVLRPRFLGFNDGAGAGADGTRPAPRALD
ncbi:MAG: MBL fold metallo-hydrolase [Paracoccaceae bacterium]|jgi:L-ascorbate metabolism protein UlaG (beta-lactamase superfamily)|nr:MBL fold metallo-hydrolase [Paracoccaceae bacterium]